MQLLQHAVGNFAIALCVGAFDLNVDRRGQAEIQNLCDDIGGQKGERRAGKFAG